MYFVWTVNSVPMTTQTYFLSFLLTANNSGLLVMLDKQKVVGGTDSIEQDEVLQHTVDELQTTSVPRFLFIKEIVTPNLCGTADLSFQYLSPSSCL